MLASLQTVSIQARFIEPLRLLPRGVKWEKENQKKRWTMGNQYHPYMAMTMILPNTILKAIPGITVVITKFKCTYYKKWQKFLNKAKQSKETLMRHLWVQIQN